MSEQPYRVCEIKRPYMQYVMHNYTFPTEESAKSWAREKCLESWCVVKVAWSGPGLNNL
jgi:hypothetical protein